MKLETFIFNFLKTVCRSMLLTFTSSPFSVLSLARLSISSSNNLMISRLSCYSSKLAVFLRILSTICSSSVAFPAVACWNLFPGALRMLLRVLTFKALECERKFLSGSVGKFSVME